jgi:hypothetical protein
MKVTAEMENLEQLVETAISENLNNLIEQEVRNIITDKVRTNAKEIIENIVNEKLTTYVEDYIKTATVSVGGGWHSDPVVYTVEEYIKHQISEIMESGKLHTKSSYGNTTVTFEEFIKQQFDATSYVKKALEYFMKQVKDDINKNVDDMFNQTTKAALSSVVMNLLSNNATFIDMQDNIKRIANG